MKKKWIGGPPLWQKDLKFMWMSMKLIGLLVFMGTMAVSASSYSQKTKIDLKVKNVLVSDILQTIEKNTKFIFIYDAGLIEALEPRTLSVRSQPVETILDELFRDTDVGYSIDDRQVFLYHKDDLLVPDPVEVRVVTEQPQKKEISGTAKDEKGNLLPGVSVVLKGTTTGTITDAGGNYTLQVPLNAQTLAFSFVGMKSQEIQIGNKTVINVVLAEETMGIEEVVAIGYGTQKKVNLTGSVSAVTSEIMESRPVQNVGQALQGMIPGLNFNTSGLGGELDQDLSFNVRGTGTIGAGSSSSPLVLIDGIEGNLNSINPQDIDNISVLKDAASSAIYGSRAAFGVILITTKKGEEGKATINYNNSFKFSSPLSLPQMMDSYTFALFFNEAQLNAGGSVVFTDEILDRIVQYQDGEITQGTYAKTSNGKWNYYQNANANTDWFDVLYKDLSFSQEHNVSINGGTQNTQYYISGNFLTQDGLLNYSNDGLNRYTFTSKIATELSKHVKFNFTTKFIRHNYEEATQQGTTFYNNIAKRWPTNPIKDPNGYYDRDSGEIPHLLQGGRRKTETDRTLMQGQLKINPLSGWNIYMEGNYSVQNDNNHADVLPVTCYFADGISTYYSAVAGYSAGYSNAYEYNLKDNYYTTNLS